MSPELFDPEKFGLKDGRRTKRSDCYALGVVIHEVLSGQVPFSRHADYIVVVRVLKGERPGRPQEEARTWFSDEIWSMLERCWKPSPNDRPSVKAVLWCLEGVSRSLTSPPHHTAHSLITSNSPARNSDPSAEESEDGSESSSPPQTVSLQQPQELSLNGNTNENSVHPSAHEFSALPHGVPYHQSLETGVINSGGSDLQESAGILDRVSRPSPLDCILCLLDDLLGNTWSLPGDLTQTTACS